jgi:hypothetical protein
VEDSHGNFVALRFHVQFEDFINVYYLECFEALAYVLRSITKTGLVRVTVNYETDSEVRVRFQALPDFF